MFLRYAILAAVLLSGTGLWIQAPATTSIPSPAATTAPPLAALQKQAATGNAEAEVALGKRLIESKDPANQVEAVVLFRKAAAQGNADAEWRLGLLYAFGDPSVGVARDVPTGLKWMRKSLSNGSARNMGTYGYMLAATGFKTGNKQETQDGVEWIRRSAKSGSAPSMNILGTLLLTGMMDVPPDKAAAKYWLLKSANLGNALSQEALGIAYLVGGFGKSDVEAGLHWLRAAAGQGSVAAEGTLAMVLITGKLEKIQITKNPQEGVQWANKAMAKHDAVGFYAMGNAYQYGEGEPKNPAKAWYNYAVAKRLDTTHQIATAHIDEHLSEVAAMLSVTQLDELEAEASKIPVPTKKQQHDEWLKLAGGA